MSQPDEQAEDGTARIIEDTVLGGLIGYRLKRAYMLIQPRAHAVLAEEGLRVASFSCLSIIIDNPGIVQSELSDALQIERSNLVVVIDELEQRGLISRKRVPTDRRRYALTATLRGRHMRDRLTKKTHLAEEVIFGRLNQEERAQFLHLLERLEGRPAR
ncbi:MarR family winged helix-turn-helix transcriptional regulator [Paracoccus sp. M683]|uniref:MarR family winged helix-turn-helix transcriptional regulator n=1 Tax=Paracoccus sp. M683 TaxID=2594268 RepID=UPI00163DB63B|nr:MarR family transcriptional regulator [Paracoccus sp. M683]